MVIVTNGPLVPEAISKHIPFPDGAGSVVVHFAVVKPSVKGKRTAGIRFGGGVEVEDELRAIETDLRREWPISDLVLARRLGEMKVGDVISVAVVAATGMKESFGACAAAVERFKAMKAVRKEELLE